MPLDFDIGQLTADPGASWLKPSLPDQRYEEHSAAIARNGRAAEVGPSISAVLTLTVAPRLWLDVDQMGGFKPSF